jgi:hypothetical protein
MIFILGIENHDLFSSLIGVQETVTIHKRDLSRIHMLINWTKFVSSFGMVFDHPISGPVFNWSGKLDCFKQKKNVLWLFS